MDFWRFATGKKIETQKVEYFIGVRSLDRVYKMLRDNQELTIESITYCQRSLVVSSSERFGGLLSNASTKSKVELKEGKLESKATVKASARNVRAEVTAQIKETDQGKDLINHDYLMIRIRTGGPEPQSFCILAEKCGGNENHKAGVYVEYVSPKEEKSKYHADLHLYKITCDAKPFKGLESIIDLLIQEPADYHVGSANCWDYSKNTTRCILEECIKRATSAEQKARLQKEYDRLKTNLRVAHISDTVGRLKNRITKPFSSK